jgi:signal transduction histidine kinase
LRVPKEKIFVEMSPIEIEQVVVNVVQNAIESQPRGATVEISLSTIDERALIEVTDDGRGIPEENLDRIFDPFFTARTREGGTGLGLSVAHGIVSDHGGEIVIQSEPDKGTRVQIYLPLESVAPDDVDER